MEDNKEGFKSLNYKYVINLQLKQTTWDKIFNTGNLIINSAGGEGEDLTLEGISNPIKIKRVVSEFIHKYHKT